MNIRTMRGMGWVRSLPDLRDYLPSTQSVSEKLGQLRRPLTAQSERPAEVDLREYFPAVYDQQQLNTSAVQACVGLVEYFERRAKGKTIEPSRLFLYMVARKLLGWKGDTGVDLRSVLKVMKTFGIPEERYWPYDVGFVDDEPDAFLYSYARPHRSMSYFRMDAVNTDGRETLELVKSFLAAGFPSVFGIPMPESALQEGEIQFRPTFDRICGGQAMIAVGYDDRRMSATRGALLIRNSWGEDWGYGGYGWLPYICVEEQMAVDFWTLLKPDWLESDEFTRPQLQS